MHMPHQHLDFTKMHGLGNDFVLIDGVNQTIDTTTLPITLLGDRQRGIGFDQLLLLKSSSLADFECLFYNADGSEAELCGNGIRCAARYVHENKLIDRKVFSIATKVGIVALSIDSYDAIHVTLTIPRIEPTIHIQLDDTSFEIHQVSMGNPHALIKVDDVANFPVKEIGQRLATHHLFPQGTNVGFIQYISKQEMLLRTYERGVGLTYACGSNACAATVVGVLHFGLDPIVRVKLPYGELKMEWRGKNQPVKMTGPAARVFEGRLSS